MTSEPTPPTSSEHAERFHINLGHPLLRLLFLLFFVRRSNSYVEVGEGVVTVRMGPMFRFSTGQDGVEGVRLRHWGSLLGWGFRYTLRGTVGLIGARSGVVEIALREPRSVRMVVFPVRCHQVAVSAEEPEALILAIQRAAAT